MQGIVRLASGRVVRMADIIRARDLSGVPVLGFDFSTLFSGKGGGEATSGWAGVLQPVIQAGAQRLMQRYAPKAVRPPPPTLTAKAPAPAPPILVMPPEAAKPAIPSWVWIAGGGIVGLGGLTVLVLALRR